MAGHMAGHMAGQIVSFYEGLHQAILWLDLTSDGLICLLIKPSSRLCSSLSHVLWNWIMLSPEMLLFQIHRLHVSLEVADFMLQVDQTLSND